jgi:hypothetical protein
MNVIFLGNWGPEYFIKIKISRQRTTVNHKFSEYLVENFKFTILFEEKDS